MPSLNHDFLKRLHDDYKKYPIFIETGTNQGDTIRAMEPHFLQLHTIEISEAYYNRVGLQYKGNKTRFILGSSEKVFPELLPEITHSAVFFLDGHWSSGDTGRGEKDCPLIEEFEAIRDHFRHSGIIIVDDYRLFGKGPQNGTCNEDWTQITKEGLLSILGDRITEVYHMESDMSADDRLIIHIREKA